MTLGIEQFRDPHELRLDHLLTQPFRDDTASRYQVEPTADSCTRARLPDSVWQDLGFDLTCKVYARDFYPMPNTFLRSGLLRESILLLTAATLTFSTTAEPVGGKAEILWQIKLGG
jgi:hypothetical protein